MRKHRPATLRDGVERGGDSDEGELVMDQVGKDRTNSEAKEDLARSAAALLRTVTTQPIFSKRLAHRRPHDFDL